MPTLRISFFVAIFVSVALHAGLLLTWQASALQLSPNTPAPPRPLVASLLTQPLDRVKNLPKPNRPKPVGVTPSTTPSLAPGKAPAQAPASMAAPPPPSAEEWATASTYTFKNSKRYRYNWGQQVRSMMGTVVEGPQQGHVRLRIEIAPDGKIARVDTLWSTSDVATKLARQAIESLPALPPTPTGQPLVFEQTIAYVPYDSGWPPIYKNDCLPDAPKFKNPFVWDGKSPTSESRIATKNTPSAGELAGDSGCPNDAEPDSIEAEAADIKRQLDFWGARPLNGVK